MFRRMDVSKRLEFEQVRMLNNDLGNVTGDRFLIYED